MQRNLFSKTCRQVEIHQKTLKAEKLSSFRARLPCLGAAGFPQGYPRIPHTSASAVAQKDAGLPNTAGSLSHSNRGLQQATRAVGHLNPLLLGESLRRHFLNSGIPDTVKGLQATSIAMTTAQKELSTALRSLSDSRGAVAQIESANNRLTYSLENRATAVDELLHEVRSDLLRLRIPLIASATLLIGLFGGMGIQSSRDSVPTAATPIPTIAAPVPFPDPQQDSATPVNSRQQRHSQAKAKPGTEYER